MTLSQLLDQLMSDGGAIVSSNSCSEIELADANAHGRFAVNADGFGFVRRPQKWLDINKNRERAHPNTDGVFSQTVAP